MPRSQVRYAVQSAVSKFGLLEVVETLAAIMLGQAARLRRLAEADGAAEALSSSWLLRDLARVLPGTRQQVENARFRLASIPKEPEKKQNASPR